MIKTPIPYSRQEITEKDIKEVANVLRTPFITQGPKIKDFEEALAGYTGAKYAVCVSSGTAALHLSAIALGLKNGDELVTSPITFSASANCAVYVGAVPKFIDIDAKTYHMDLDKFESYIKKASNRKRLKVVVPVHLMGTVFDMEGLNKICSKYGIKIIEDAAHALGAKYKTKNSNWTKVGSPLSSDITILSFHPIKHITTGEGGAVLTNDKKIYEKVLRLRHHGIIKTNPASWEYDIPEVGFNYRITDFQCALGLSQLKRLNRMVEIRRRIVKKYNDEFKGIKGLILPFERENTHASYHLYVIRVKNDLRDKLYYYLRERKIYTQVNYLPVHLLKFYKDTYGYKNGDFPNAEQYSREALSLPLYVGLNKNGQDYVIGSIKSFFNEN